MSERTKRGDEDKKVVDEELDGKPVEETKAEAAAATRGTNTRDRSVEPVGDEEGAIKSRPATE